MYITGTLIVKTVQKEAPETLDIVDRNQRKIRTLDFISPVRQVINGFVHKEEMRKVRGARGTGGGGYVDAKSVG